MRSHPPTLLTLITRALHDECNVTKDSRVLIALSGGPDSMTLLHALYILSKKNRVGDLFAHGVDHGLREDAARELDVAEEFCASIAVPFTRSRLHVAQGGNLQARARDARYAALEEARVSVGAELIATAHHADDRAETVLIRLLRGAPPEGLAVLPARAGIRIRPMIRARRTDVLAHLTRHHVPKSEDPSNASKRFLRARVRAELMPLLAELSPNIVDHLCDLADALETPRKSLPNGIDPRLESHHALLAAANLASGKHPRARVSLKGGVVLSRAGAHPPGEEPELVESSRKPHARRFSK